MRRRFLISGWFSFEQVVATTGDLLAADVVCGWLRDAGEEFDMAVAPFLEGGMDWRELDPLQYTDLIFVCGPLHVDGPVAELLERFASCRLTALDVSLLDEGDREHFDAVLARDGIEVAQVDLSLAACPQTAPVAGVALAPATQREYPDGRHAQVDAAVWSLLHSIPAAVIDVDTDLARAGRFRQPAEVDSLMARCDVVVTSRLHGVVLALRQGVPALAVDPIPGGAKVKAQTNALRWPATFTADRLDPAKLRQSFEWCLSQEARERARECRQQGLAEIERIRSDLFASLDGSPRLARGHR